MKGKCHYYIHMLPTYLANHHMQKVRKLSKSWDSLIELRTSFHLRSGTCAAALHRSCPLPTQRLHVLSRGFHMSSF